MKVLFTGGSSFSGYWFIKTLVSAGHDVSVPLKRSRGSYQGVRAKRVEKLLPLCTVIENAPLGSAAFNHLIETQNWDLFCHHAADVTNYKSPDFNPIQALENNTNSLIKALSSGHIKRFLLTGSVFEKAEGKGDTQQAISPYGLSKSLTSLYLHYYCDLYKIPFSKFIIPNPFGPYEEARYTAYLMKQWLINKSVHIQTPDYIRDNIPIDLLSLAYLDCVQNGHAHMQPSGYVGSQAAFTEKFAQEMRPRLALPCHYTSALQTQFLEPLMRINTEPQLNHPAWSENCFWDSVAAYYQ